MVIKFILFSLVALRALEAVTAAVDCVEEKEKIDLKGYFTLETDPGNEDFAKYMKAMEFSEKFQKNITDTKKVLIHISAFNGIRGGKHWVVKYMTKANRHKESWKDFPSGKEFLTKLNWKLVRNIVIVDDNAKTAHWSSKFDTVESTQNAPFCHDGINLIVKAKDAVATLSFNRWRNQPHYELDPNRDHYFGDPPYSRY